MFDSSRVSRKLISVRKRQAAVWRKIPNSPVPDHLSSTSSSRSCSFLYLIVGPSIPSSQINQFLSNIPLLIVRIP